MRETEPPTHPMDGPNPSITTEDTLDMTADTVTILKVQNGEISPVELPREDLTYDGICRLLGAERLTDAFLPWSANEWLEGCCVAEYKGADMAYVAEGRNVPVAGTAYLIGRDEEGNWHGLSKDQRERIRIAGPHPLTGVPLLVIDD